MLKNLDPAVLLPSAEWFAVYTVPRHEKRVRQHFDSRCIESFLPTYRTVHRWKNGCRIALELPLFPNYLFVHINKRERVRVLDIPGVLGLVGSGAEPIALPAADIDSLRSGLHLRSCEPHAFISAGDLVRIVSGPLMGASGVVMRTSQKLRVVLSIELIQRSVAVEVSVDEIEPLNARAVN